MTLPHAPAGPGSPMPPRPARSSRLWQVLAALFAVTTLTLAAVLLWPAGEAEAEVEQPVLGSAQSTAELACQILEELPTAGAEVTSREYAVVQGQVAVVASLGWLASAQDAEYSTFRTATDEPRARTTSLHQLDGPEFTEAMDGAHAACAEYLAAED